MAEIEKIGSVTSRSLIKHTKLGWAQWIELLNKAGAQNLNYQQIVSYLKKKKNAKVWWAHIVAGGYEIHQGRRLPGQHLNGTYSVIVTKTFPLTRIKAYQWLTQKDIIDIWLKPLSPIQIEKGQVFETAGGVYGEIRTFKKNFRIRFTWNESDGEASSVVQLLLFDGGQGKMKNKCAIGFQHEKIKNAREKAIKRDYWKSVIDQLVKKMNMS